MADLCDNLKKTKRFSTVRQMYQDAFHNGRKWFLGAYTRRQLVEVYDPLLNGLPGQHNEGWRDMQTLKLKKMRVSDKIANRMARIAYDQQGSHLSETLLEGTFWKLFPHQAQFNNIPALGPEVNARRRQAHARARKNYLAMNTSTRKLYFDILEDFRKYYRDTKDQIIKIIEETAPNTKSRREAIMSIRNDFENEIKQGIYFPLSRFGEWIGIAKRIDPGTKEEVERLVSAFETAGDLRSFKKELEAEGWDVKEKFKGKFSAEKDGPSSETVRKIFKALDEAGQGENWDLKDGINQIFLKALPDVSYRKHFIRRKNVAGFSRDVTRAYNHATFHAAHHLGNLTFGRKLDAQIKDMQKFADDKLTGDEKKMADQVAEDFKKRLDWNMKNSIHPFVHWLGSIGFMWNIGPGASSVLVNLTQVPFFTLPYVASQKGVGYIRASALMGKWYRWRSARLMTTQLSKDPTLSKRERLASAFRVDISDDPTLTDDQRDMLKQLIDRGVHDLGQAVDLAAMSELDFTDRFKSKARIEWAKINRAASFPFHYAEVINRQISSLVAYEAAREHMKMDHQPAIDFAAKATYDTQLDYTTANRAPMMQGNALRVLTQFKTYSQGVTFIMGRQFYQMVKGETPEIRRQALKHFSGIMGMHVGAAGLMGLPIYSFAGAIMEALMNGIGPFPGFGDEDDPFDWDAAFRNALAAAFTAKGGEVLARGLSRLTPMDLSRRTNLDLPELWFGPPSRPELEGRELFQDRAFRMLGPVMSNAAMAFDGLNDFSEGRYTRAFEKMSPKFLRDLAKVYRFWAEGGIKTAIGDPILEDINILELVATAMGFQISRSAEGWEGTNILRRLTADIKDRKSYLINSAVAARKKGDVEAIQQLQVEIMHFNGANRRNPSFQIKTNTIRDAMKRRLKRARETDKGIYMRGNTPGLREKIRFIPEG